jgi:hypothetical protein
MQPPSELNRFALTATGRRSRYGFCFVLRDIQVWWTTIHRHTGGSFRMDWDSPKPLIRRTQRGVTRESRVAPV